MLGFILMMQQRGRRRPSASTRYSTSLPNPRRARRRRPGGVPRRVDIRDARFTYNDGPRSRRSQLHVPRARPSPSSDAPGSGKTPWPDWSLASMTSAPERSAWMAATFGTSPSPACDPMSASALTSPSCFSGLDSRQHRLRPAGSRRWKTSSTAAPGQGAHEFVLKLDHGYDTDGRRTGYTLSGGQRHASPSPGPSSRTPPSLILRRRHQRNRRQDRDADSRSPARGDVRAHHPDHRPPPRRSVWPNGSCSSRAARYPPTAPTSSLMTTEPRYARCWPTWRTTTKERPRTSSTRPSPDHILTADEGTVADPLDEFVLDGAARILTPDSLDVADGAHFFAGGVADRELPSDDGGPSDVRGGGGMVGGFGGRTARPGSDSGLPFAGCPRDGPARLRRRFCLERQSRV